MDPYDCINYISDYSTLSFRTMYIWRWWKSKYMILHTYITTFLIIKLIEKNHKQYIFPILGKKRPKLGKKCHFWIFPKNAKMSFFRLQRLGLVQKLGNSNKRIVKELQKTSILGILGQNGKYWTVFGQNGQNGNIFQKSAWNIFFALTSPNSKVSEKSKRFFEKLCH